MSSSLFEAVELVLAAAGSPARVVGSEAATGGCIHDSRLLRLSDGRQAFVKGGGEPAMYRAEAEGLEALAAVGVLRVPAVLGLGSGTPCLVLEAVPTGPRSPGFSAAFGHAFATHHRNASGERFGFPADNFLGATPQPNGWEPDWCTFWRKRRLGHQLALARRNGASDGELDRLGERLSDRLEEWLDLDEPPCLLHGDLWGGNYLVDEGGAPVLIDPAAYYGHREADLAMTRLFGGFDEPFYRAYEETWPLAPGSEERLAIYELYHLLNHLNLFGLSYRPGCLAILRRLVG